MINWKVRIKSKTFWVSLVPAVLLLIQTVAAEFGYDWDMILLNKSITIIINAVFGILTVIGVIADPTTEGISDSAEAMTYECPKCKQK